LIVPQWYGGLDSCTFAKSTHKTMNWLAHLLLSERNTENRLGNLLGDLDGIADTLKRIEHRIKRRSGRQINLLQSMEILEQECMNLEQDFQSFFSELQKKMLEYSANH
jgi:acyl carrier protein phosphodiesterase